MCDAHSPAGNGVKPPWRRNAGAGVGVQLRFELVVSLFNNSIMQLAQPRALRASLTALGLSMATSLASGQSVLVVDASGGGTHVSFVNAVNSASDGDTIVVRSGTYALGIAPLSIQGKGLRIVGEDGAYPTLLGRIEVSGVGPTQNFLMDHLVMQSIPLLNLAGIAFTNCQGPVWIEDMTIDAVGTPRPAVLMDEVDVGSITLLNAYAGDAPYLAAYMPPGIEIEDSTVFISASFAVGGELPSTVSASSNGGHAVRLDSSDVFIRSTRLWGGDGLRRPNSLGGCSMVGSGGDCIAIFGSNSEVSYDALTESEFQPGESNGTGGCLPYIQGENVDDNGSNTTLPPLPLEALYSYASVTPAVQQVPGTPTSITVQVEGPVGSQFRLFAANAPTGVAADLDLGILLSAPRVPYLSGVISGATASNSYTLTLPPFPAGFGSFTLYCQSIAIDPTTPAYTPGGTHTVVIYE